MDINEQIRSNYGLVYSLLKTFHLWNDPEAISIALEALGKAIVAFDPSKDIKLATFAHCCIYNALGSYVRELKRKKQIETVSYDCLMPDGHPYLDRIASSVDIEDEQEQKAFKVFLLRGICDICNGMRGKKQQIVILWKEGGFQATSVDLAKKIGCSQSYASEAMSAFRNALRRKLEEYKNAGI